MVTLNGIGNISFKFFDTKFFRLSSGFEGQLKLTRKTITNQQIWSQGAEAGVAETYNHTFQRGFEYQFDQHGQNIKDQGGVNGVKFGFREGLNVASQIVNQQAQELAEIVATQEGIEAMNNLRDAFNTTAANFDALRAGQVLRGMQGTYQMNAFNLKVNGFTDGEKISYRQLYEDPKKESVLVPQYQAMLQLARELQIPANLQQESQFQGDIHTAWIVKGELRLEPVLKNVPVLGPIAKRTGAKIGGSISKKTKSLFDPKQGWGYDVGISMNLIDFFNGPQSNFEATLECSKNGCGSRQSVFINDYVKNSLTYVAKRVNQTLPTPKNQKALSENQTSQKAAQSEEIASKSVNSHTAQLASLSSAAYYHTEDFEETSANAVADFVGRGEQQCYQLVQPRPLPESTSGLTTLSATAGVFALGLSAACLVLLKVSSKLYQKNLFGTVEAQLFKVAEGKMTFQHPCTYSTSDEWVENPEHWFGLA